jgi:hypothetical protein
VLSEGSFRGMRERSLEWLSMVRSAVAGIPREYRLIGASDSGIVFFGCARKRLARRSGGQGWRTGGLAGAGGGRGGGVGMWESGKLDATGRRLFVFCG